MDRQPMQGLWGALFGIALGIGLLSSVIFGGIFALRALHGGDKEGSLYLVDAPAITDPPLLRSNESGLPASTEVVGIEADGQAIAFVLNSMKDDPRLHLVSLNLGNASVSMTYCDVSECVRVLENDQQSSDELRVGGLYKGGDMILTYGGNRYLQGSKLLPLKDRAYTRTSLQDWLLQHPDSLIYNGPAESPVGPVEYTVLPVPE